MSSKTAEGSKEGHGSQRPKIKLAQPLMPVLIIRNFDDYSIKNERVSMETPFSH